MSEQTEGQAPDIMQLWREWLAQSERQFNACFNETMNTEAFARTMGGYMEMTAAFQRLVGEGMQRYLAFINMPSRSDVMGLGDALRLIEDRLAHIEQLLRIATGVVEAPAGAFELEREPARTRVPPGVPRAEEVPAEMPAPEQVVPAEAPALPETAPVAAPAAPEAETLRALEERLARIEETLQIAVGTVEAGERESAWTREPAPYRVTVGVLADERGRAEETVIPEELRR